MDDLISRQAAIDVLCEICRNAYPETTACNICDEIKAIKELPSVQPQKGKWIKISPANIYECSECGKNVMTDDISAYDFCHGCGAEMREGDAE